MMFAIGLLLGWVLFLRGGQLHNYLVLEAEKIFRKADYNTRQEAPKQLTDGRVDFIDLLVQKGDFLLCVEVETSARNVVSNVNKADLLGLPLVVIVPTRTVQEAIKNRLTKVHAQPGGYPISILLLSQLQQAVTNYFPLISTVNDNRENRKLNPRKQK